MKRFTVSAGFMKRFYETRLVRQLWPCDSRNGTKDLQGTQSPWSAKGPMSQIGLLCALEQHPFYLGPVSPDAAQLLEGIRHAGGDLFV